MGTLWSELDYTSTFQVIKNEGEQSENQAALALIEKFIGYVRQSGGQAGTVGLPTQKMKLYEFSTSEGQANHIAEILQYGLNMCEQSPKQVAVHLGEDSKYTVLGMVIYQGSKRTMKEHFICLSVQYGKTNQTVKSSYFYNSQEWNKKGGN